MGTGVHEYSNIPKGQSPFPVTSLSDVNGCGLAGRCGLELFFPCEHNLYGFSCGVAEKDGNILVGVGFQLRSKSPSDRGLNNPHPLPTKAHRLQGISKSFLGEGRNLCVAVEHQIAFWIEGGNTTTGPQAAMGDPGGIKPVFNHPTRTSAAFFQISTVQIGRQGYQVRSPFLV